MKTILINESNKLSICSLLSLNNTGEKKDTQRAELLKRLLKQHSEHLLFQRYSTKEYDMIRYMLNEIKRVINTTRTVRKRVIAIPKLQLTDGMRKYQVLQKMGIPMDTIRNKMKKDGVESYD